MTPFLGCLGDWEAAEKRPSIAGLRRILRAQLNKTVLKIMLGLFQPKELKLISKALDLLGSRAGCPNAFAQARLQVERSIKHDPAAFIHAISMQKTPPEQIAAASVANASGDILETGTLCLYRGVLSPVGEEMMELFRIALHELVRMEVATQKDIDQQISAVRTTIRTVG